MTAQCSAVTARAVPAGVFARPEAVLPPTAFLTIGGRLFAYLPVAPEVSRPVWVMR